MIFKDLLSLQKEYAPEKILFIGLGNTYRGDDGAGLLFLQRLEQTVSFSQSHFINAGTNPENYLQHILDLEPHLLIFIDCAEWGAQPGTIDWLDTQTIDSVNISTHAFSIKMVQQYIEAQMDLVFKYIGIQPFQKSFGQSISPELVQIIDTFFEKNANFNF